MQLISTDNCALAKNVNLPEKGNLLYLRRLHRTTQEFKKLRFVGPTRRRK